MRTSKPPAKTHRAAEQSTKQIALVAKQVDLATREVRLRVRPYVSPRIEVRWQTRDRFEFRFHLKNTGVVPAQESRIVVQARLADDDLGIPNEGILVLFPGEDYISAWSGVNNDGIHNGRTPLRVKIRVEYAGPWEGESYLTAIAMKWTPAANMFVNESMAVT